MEQTLKELNDFWKDQAEITLLEPFIYNDKWFKGSIRLHASPKEDLIFEVAIPLSYPYSVSTISIHFICKNIKGIRHLNPDGSICIRTPKNNSFKSRMVEEVRLLKEWRDGFYINDSPDERYEYLNVVSTDNNKFLFTDFTHELKKGDWGYFNAHVFSDFSKQTSVEAKLFYIQNIDKYNCQWSNFILENKKNQTTGVFFFIGDEPIGIGKWNATSWKEIERYFSQSNKERLYEIKNWRKKQNLFILLGYNIPNSPEIHWQVINIPNFDIPVKGKKIIRNYFEYEFLDVPINWGQTVNSSYNRYFGRGALNFELANKKILIIGVGAIGSSLAKILARSGCISISLADMDTIEPGNICRAEFYTEEISLPKFISVARQLNSISPFINLGFEDPLDKILEEPFFTKTKARLNQYDIIFDCTSDMELAVILDQLQLNTRTINLSVSNGAENLVCVSGGHNISKEKAMLFQNLDQADDELVYEGTGCWNPTFSASYFDINSLLNLAVKNLNKQYTKKAQFNTFIISTEVNETSINLKTVDY